MISQKKRLIVTMILVTVIAVGCFIRLMSMQVVNGEAYQELIDQGYSTTYSVTAARGEIVDRYGRTLAANRVSHNISFDKNTMPSDETNAIILDLCGILSDAGEEWNDSLPLSETAPFSFTGSDSSVSRLKKMLDQLPEFATADDAVYWLRERYDLQEYSDADFRIVAGVRYEMERQGYNANTPYTFAEDISEATMTYISEHNYQLPGVSITEGYEREYPAGDVAPHLIGLVGPIFEEEYEELDHSVYGMNDEIGKSGIESAFEDELRGKDGTVKVSYDSDGNVVGEETVEEPLPGDTVVLTLDMDLQRVAQQALEKQILNLRATAEAGKGKESEGGACVVIQVGTGDILACATYPSFNLFTYNQDYNTLLETAYHPLFNRATEGVYAAGSTFKPVVATGGLMEGIITATTQFVCTGRYTYYSDYQPTCLRAHGAVNVISALGYSCNCFFYEVGRQLGIDNIRQYAYYYGLGEPTGIEIAENIGQVSSPEYANSVGDSWQAGDVLQTSIGQSYNQFNPVQFANYAATIANHGVRVNAHLVKSIDSYDFSDVISETQTVVLSDMQMTDYTYDTVLAGMEQSSVDSSGFVWSGFDIPVASKTGTPQTNTEHCTSTFICFAPADDPQIAVAVIIEKGWHGYTAAPVAKEIFQYYFHGGDGGTSAVEDALLG